MKERRKLRAGLRVVHRHRVGNHVFRRVSELVFIEGRPKALLGWIDIGGVRTPLYICELDRDKLRQPEGAKNVYYYDDITVDPRYEELPAPTGAGEFNAPRTR
jgi:hypothetical protein